MIQRKRRQLMIRLQNPDEEEIHRNVDEIESRIQSIFQNHIGSENAISSIELFKKVMKIDPEEITVFERAYLWNLIKAILSRLRGAEVLFVVNDNFNYYVLQTSEELSMFNTRVDNHIRGLKLLKKKAKDWVRKKSWRNI